MAEQGNHNGSLYLAGLCYIKLLQNYGIVIALWISNKLGFLTVHSIIQEKLLKVT